MLPLICKKQLCELHVALVFLPKNTGWLSAVLSSVCHACLPRIKPCLGRLFSIQQPEASVPAPLPVPVLCKRSSKYHISHFLPRLCSGVKSCFYGLNHLLYMCCRGVGFMWSLATARAVAAVHLPALPVCLVFDCSVSVSTSLWPLRLRYTSSL